MALDARRPARVDHLYELSPELSRTWFGDTGTYARYGVVGDGSCFYHSVCVILNKDGYVDAPASRRDALAHGLRCGLQAELTPDEFKFLAGGTDTGKDFRATREALCQPSEWADEVAIRKTSLALNLNLIFINPADEQAYCGVHGAETLDAASPCPSPTTHAHAHAHTPRHGTAGPAAAGWARGLPQATGIIAWINGAHFEPIVRVESVDEATGAARIRTLFDPAHDAVDAAMVRHLMTAYTKQCSDAVRDAHVSPRR